MRSTSIDRAAVAATTPRSVVLARLRAAARPQSGWMFARATAARANVRSALANRSFHAFGAVPGRHAFQKRTSRSAAVDTANIGTGFGSPRSRRAHPRSAPGKFYPAPPGVRARDAGAQNCEGKRDPPEFWTPVCQKQEGKRDPPSSGTPVCQKYEGKRVPPGSGTPVWGLAGSHAHLLNSITLAVGSRRLPAMRATSRPVRCDECCARLIRTESHFGLGAFGRGPGRQYRPGTLVSMESSSPGRQRLSSTSKPLGMRGGGKSQRFSRYDGGP